LREALDFLNNFLIDVNFVQRCVMIIFEVSWLF